MPNNMIPKAIFTVVRQGNGVVITALKRLLRTLLAIHHAEDAKTPRTQREEGFLS